LYDFFLQMYIRLIIESKMPQCYIYIQSLYLPVKDKSKVNCILSISKEKRKTTTNSKYDQIGRVNSLDNMMKSISTDAKLSKVHTNHSVIRLFRSIVEARGFPQLPMLTITNLNIRAQQQRQPLCFPLIFVDISRCLNI